VLARVKASLPGQGYPARLARAEDGHDGIGLEQFLEGARMAGPIEPEDHPP